MTLTDLFLAELEQEGTLTRRALEQVPEGQADWAPHERSMSLGRLSELVAHMPSWIAMVIEQDQLDVNPSGGSAHAEPSMTPGLIETLDAGIASGREALSKTTDAHLETTWRMLAGGHVVSEQPRRTVLRHGVFNHLVHHRGQLTVYLRLLGAMVPAIYGPSADDRRFS